MDLVRHNGGIGVRDVCRDGISDIGVSDGIAHLSCDNGGLTMMA